jgi:hypothetical protein
MEYIEFIITVDGNGYKTTKSFPTESLTEILATEDSVTLFFNAVTANLSGDISVYKYYYGTRIVLTRSGEGSMILAGLNNLLAKAYSSDVKFPTVINLTQLANTIDVYDIVGSIGYPLPSGGYYGSFYDTTTQTNAGATAANPITYNSTDLSYGVSITSNSHIAIANQGIYNIQFSAQVAKTDSGRDFFQLWLSKNGTNIPDTTTSLYLDGNDAKTVAAWNFVVGASASDFFELYWHSIDTDVSLFSEGATANPPRPAIPSVILTVTWVGNPV